MWINIPPKASYAELAPFSIKVPYMLFKSRTRPNPTSITTSTGSNFYIVIVSTCYLNVLNTITLGTCNIQFLVPGSVIGRQVKILAWCSCFQPKSRNLLPYAYRSQCRGDMLWNPFLASRKDRISCTTFCSIEVQSEAQFGRQGQKKAEATH